MAAIYTSVPDGLTSLLEAHLPHSLPVLRRLQFTRFPGGMRPTARVIFASDTPLPSSSGQDGSPAPRHFTAAYLDFGSHIETQLFLYSTLEDGGLDGDAEAREASEAQVDAALAAVARVSAEQPENRAYPGGCLVGTLATATRDAMVRRGARVEPRAVDQYEKWLFRVEELPDVDVVLPDGAAWAPATEADCEVVISRTYVPRQVYVFSAPLIPVPGRNCLLTRRFELAKRSCRSRAWCSSCRTGRPSRGLSWVGYLTHSHGPREE